MRLLCINIFSSSTKKSISALSLFMKLHIHFDIIGHTMADVDDVIAIDKNSLNIGTDVH